jgi:hypothetical protein
MMRDYSNDFQNLIDLVGTDTLLMGFATYLAPNSEPVDIYIKGDEEGVRMTRQVRVPDTFSGVAFDGAHWKGYVHGKCMYNSYQDLQKPGTNNYCQSYATYLWAHKGGLGNFVKNDYVGNVQKMSKLWLDFLKTKRTHSREMKHAIKTLSEIVSNRSVATEFANSKED